MNYEIRKILVPKNFEIDNENALNTGFQLAAKYNAELHIVNIIPYETVGNQTSLYDDNTETEKKLLSNSYSNLEAYRERNKGEPHIKIKTFAKVGEIDVSLIIYARDNGIDLIIMNPKNYSGFKRFFLGSITYEVVKYSRCPVLVLPENCELMNFNKVLFPMRNVEGVESKIYYLTPFIDRNKTKIHLFKLIDNDSNNNEQDELRDLKDFRFKIMPYCESISLDLFSSENVAEEILNKVLRRKDGLIAINATLEKKWYKIFSENFTQYLINHSSVAILCIKSQVIEDYTEQLESSGQNSFMVPFTY